MDLKTSKTWLVYGDILNRHVVDSFCEALVAAGDSVVRLASLQRSHRYLAEEDVQQQVLKRVEECVHEHQVDALFNFRASELGPSALDFLRRKGITSFVWLPDDPLLYGLCYRHVVDFYDIVLHCGHEDVISFYRERHPGVNSFNFPFWSDSKFFYYAYDPDNSTCDLGFVGNCHTEGRAGRYELLASLPFRVSLYGLLPHGFVDSAGIHRGYLEKCDPAVTGRFKVALNIPQYFKDSAATEYRFDDLYRFESFFFPSRIIQYAGSGIPTVSPKTRHADKIIPSLMTYESRDDLVCTVERLIADPDRLLAVSKQARSDFETLLTASARVQMLKGLLLNYRANFSVAERCELWKIFAQIPPAPPRFPAPPADRTADIPATTTARGGMEQRLYARGFLLAKQDAAAPSHWTRVRLDDYSFCYDPATPFHHLSGDGCWIAILGRVIDTSKWSMELPAIADQGLHCLRRSALDLYDYLDVLSGRFLIVFSVQGKVSVLHDATGMRSVFYHACQERPVVASHARLVAEVVDAKPSKVMDPAWLSKGGGLSTSPGHFTPYDDVYCLTPNTLLETDTMSVHRYFPREDLSPSSVEAEGGVVLDMMQKQLALLNGKHDLVVSLTAGIDSRTLLAAAKEIADDISFFTYFKTDCDAGSQKSFDTDRTIACDLADNLRLKHRVINFADGEVKTAGLRDLLARHVFREHGFALAETYLNELPKDALHVRSNLAEIGRTFYRKNRGAQRTLSALQMAEVISRNGVGDAGAVTAFEAWREVVAFDEIRNYDPYDIFYWEHRMGTWHASLLLESDVAHDTFIVYNCRSILKKMLSLPFEQRLNASLFHEIIRCSWPVLEKWPINALASQKDPVPPDFVDSGLLLSTACVGSGSLHDAGASVESLVRQEARQVMFWMRRSDPCEGEFASYTTPVEVQEGKGYWAVVELRSPYRNPQFNGRLAYQILLDGQPLLEEDVSAWDEVNHVAIKWQAKKPAYDLQIRVVATKQCETWNWGWAGRIIVKRIQIRELDSLEANEVTCSSPFSRVSVDNVSNL